MQPKVQSGSITMHAAYDNYRLCLAGLGEGLRAEVKRARPEEEELVDLVLNTPLVGDDMLTDPLSRIVNE
jgi:hypothetical protein